jgi:transporter family-2 protein
VHVQPGSAVFGLLLVFSAGVSFVVQQAVNANLRIEIGSAWWAGFVSYLGGTLAMFAMAVLLREPLPSTHLIHRSHGMSWSGGFFGAVYIAISILLLPKLGATTVIAFIVAGQLIGSILLNRASKDILGDVCRSSRETARDHVGLTLRNSAGNFATFAALRSLRFFGSLAVRNPSSVGHAFVEIVLDVS